MFINETVVATLRSTVERRWSRDDSGQMTVANAMRSALASHAYSMPSG
ncbi:MAG: hypothetical protein ICV79_23490 [Flavisolibacter sp.]|nr:hypothetical protein [Flavisolibacter sp.]